jgi:outer membrane protein assembly factor BamA
MRRTLCAASLRTLCAATLLLAVSAAAPGQAPKTGPRTKDGRAGVNAGRKGAVARVTRRLVETVEVEGNRRLTDEEILAHVRSRPGQAYDEYQVRRDLQSLLDLGVFDKTQTRVQTAEGLRGGVVVIFMVMELPIVDAVRFEGLPKGLTEDDVSKALREKGLGVAKGDVYDPVRLHRAREAAEALLAARGFKGMSVEASIEEVTATSVSVKLAVIDGR